MTTYTIPQKSSGTGNINDISSDQFDRDIIFASGCKFAVVLASYYGGKGYTTHKTADAAIAASARISESHTIIGRFGDEYTVYGDGLISIIKG